MLGSLARGLARNARTTKHEAILLQQIRLLNIHEYQVKLQYVNQLLKVNTACKKSCAHTAGVTLAETIIVFYNLKERIKAGVGDRFELSNPCILQGSEQMSKFGVNVPPGIPVFSLDEIDNAATQMKSPDGQVSCA